MDLSIDNLPPTLMKYIFIEISINDSFLFGLQSHAKTHVSLLPPKEWLCENSTQITIRNLLDVAKKTNNNVLFDKIISSMEKIEEIEQARKNMFAIYQRNDCNYSNLSIDFLPLEIMKIILDFMKTEIGFCFALQYAISGKCILELPPDKWIIKHGKNVTINYVIHVLEKMNKLLRYKIIDSVKLIDPNYSNAKTESNQATTIYAKRLKIESNPNNSQSNDPEKKFNIHVEELYWEIRSDLYIFLKNDAELVKRIIKYKNENSNNLGGFTTNEEKYISDNVEHGKKESNNAIYSLLRNMKIIDLIHVLNKYETDNSREFKEKIYKHYSSE